jgi:hypothetical protein
MVTPVSFRFYMQPTEYRTTVCTGDAATYSLAVYAEGSGSGPEPVTLAWRGVRVEASVDDAALGTLSPPSAITEDFSGGVSTADFRFKAGKKNGTTNLQFKGSVAGFGTVSFKIPIRVVDCKFKVSGVVFFPPDTAYIPLPDPPLEGTLRPTQLTADTDGHLSAHALIHWGNGKTIANIPPDVVTATSRFGPDQEVIVNGEVSDDGILTLTFEFPMANGTITWTDIAGSTIQDLPTAYIVNKVTVKISTDGGTVKVPASYTTTGTGGTATFVVKKLTS